jgi:CRP-like cAMP-binding protein
VEEHFMGDALATVGQRTAIQAVSWALAKIYIRAMALGMVNNGSMQFPFKQQDLADALGLSLVHTNKTLAILKSKQLAQWSDGTLRIPDLKGLGDIALLEDLVAPKRPIM